MYDGLTPLFDNVTAARPRPSTSSPRRSAARHRRARQDREGAAHGRQDHARQVQRPARQREDLRRRHLGRRLDRRGGPRAAARAGALQLARRRDRRPGPHGARPDREPQDLQAERADRGRARASRRRSCRRPGPRASRSCTTSTRSSRASTHYMALNSPSTAPWTRNDVYALDALKGQFVGQGGGDEARRTQFLCGLSHSSAPTKGMSVFNDLRQHDEPGQPDVDRRQVPVRAAFPKHAPGNVIIDPGSFQRDARPSPARSSDAGPPSPTVSNELMIDAQALGDRPPAARRRPADRLLLPRPHLRDRHARARPGVARRDVGAVPRLHADRPRRGLRQHADLGRAATSSTSTPRRSAAAATRSTCTRASA